MEKHPSQFDNIRYDKRNCQQAGQYRGVGTRGKVGKKPSSPSPLDTKVRVEKVSPLNFN